MHYCNLLAAQSSPFIVGSGPPLQWSQTNHPHFCPITTRCPRALQMFVVGLTTANINSVGAVRLAWHSACTVLLDPKMDIHHQA